MANINDFKLLATKCKAYYNFLELDLGRTLPVQSSIQKERIGFYLLMLESICDIKDVSDMLNLIVDEEFNGILFNNKYEDYGIDAIYIDEDSKYINLFNFKYREKFKVDQQQSLNESFLSTKYTIALLMRAPKVLKEI